MTLHVPLDATLALAESSVLDRPAQALQHAIHALYEAAGPAGRTVKNFLHGVWLGHPLHPVLTAVPIGAWTAAVALDTLELTFAAGLGAGAMVALGSSRKAAAPPKCQPRRSDRRRR